ncbi:MAG: hypothetical protein IIZ09_14095 [Ruminococcus sp.]|nr:hypothetical protein [Ruminococcus sp.]
MTEKNERGHSGSKCRDCPYWTDKCKEINERHPHQTHQPMESLCWCCKNAVPDRDGVNGCEWSLYSQPVPGWKVSSKKAFARSDGKQAYTYKVERCPKFERG